MTGRSGKLRTGLKLGDLTPKSGKTVRFALAGENAAEAHTAIEALYPNHDLLDSTPDASFVIVGSAVPSRAGSARVKSEDSRR
jgi:hypothetical protein